MAEAMVQVSNRYFCHKCSQEINPVLPDFVCPRCRLGFIEEVTNSQSLSIPSDDESQSDALFEELISSTSRSNQSSESSDGGGGGGGGEAGQRSFIQTTNYPRVRLRYSEPNDSNQYQNFQGILHLISNITQGSGLDFPFNMDLFQVLYGNPGDYAWGSGGLDAIITQLLNQMDGTGPPPMPKEEINQLPTVKITQEQVDKNLQCTVCMEDFVFDEPVKKLSCTHVYHKDCILPWLEMHGTCPICRKLLNKNDPQSSNSNNSTNTLNFRDVIEANRQRSNPSVFSPQQSSSSQQQRTQTNNNNSNSNNNNRNNRRNQNRQQNNGYFEMDDYD